METQSTQEKEAFNKKYEALQAELDEMRTEKEKVETKLKGTNEMLE